MKNLEDVVKRLRDRDGNRCSICGIPLTDYNISIDHVLPCALGGTDNFNNLRLLCKNCNCKYANLATNEYEFEKYISEIIKKNKNYRNIELEVSLGKDKKNIADIVAERKIQSRWERIIIGIKYSTSLTIDRVKGVVEKFKEKRTSSLLIQNNIEIWDVDYIASKFKNEIMQTDHPIFCFLLTHNTPVNKSMEQVLIDKLKECKPGKENWSKYQKLIGQILNFLFCPPLLTPLSENSDALKVNRRDFILPNYCETGFWAFLRSRYPLII